MSDSDDSETAEIIDSIPDEVAGKIVKKAASSNLADMQDQVRRLGEQFIQRNSMFTAKVQSKNRLSIPGPEAEKLGVEQGDLVQVAITPVESQLENDSED